MSEDSHLERKTIDVEEQGVLRNILQDMYCSEENSFDDTFDMNNAWMRKDDEGSKFAALKNLFWIKVCALHSFVLQFLENNC